MKFYGLLTSESNKKLPPLSDAVQEVRRTDIRMREKYFEFALAGFAADSSIPPQPFGPYETILGSIMRRSHLVTSLKDESIPPSILRAFGPDWRFDKHEPNTLIFSAESGMMTVGEWRHVLIEMRSKDPNGYARMNSQYQRWREAKGYKTDKLLLPDIDYLMKVDSSIYTDTASTRVLRVESNNEASVWTPGVIMPSLAVETAKILRQEEEPNILVADVIEMMIEEDFFHGKLPNVEFERTDPHSLVTNGELPRRDTIQAGFEAVTVIALDKRLI